MLEEKRGIEKISNATKNSDSKVDKKIEAANLSGSLFNVCAFFH